jgi:transcriptional regulator with XRE-family HTH domain
MNSQELIETLKENNISQYKVAKALGVGTSLVSNVKSGKRNFTADQLSVLVEKGIINKSTAKNVNFFDNLKDKRHYSAVAAIAICVPVLSSLLTHYVYYVKLQFPPFFHNARGLRCHS